ncbi:O-antigen ligase family protein [Polymorphum gilvum]|uniref:O-antigen ligase family protein n=1 Tax=Polymorphum gilvum TaxID=991904 RepID=UPI0009FDD185|nr:O-antigen ligase family protein [Polymorphum gilvum]
MTSFSGEIFSSRLERVSGSRIKDNLFFWLIFLYLMCSPVLYFRVGGNSVSAVDFIGSLSIVLLLIFSSKKVTYYTAFYVGYICMAFFSVAASSEPGVGLSNLALALRLLFIFMPFILIEHLDLRFLANDQRLVKAMFFSSYFAVVLGLGLYALGIEVRDSQHVLWLGSGYGAAMRAGGIVGNPASYGLVAAFLLFSGMLYRKLCGGSYIIIMTSFLASFAAIIVSSSRGALLMLVVFSMVYFMTNLRRALLGVVGLFILIPALLLSALFLDVRSLPPGLYAAIRRLDMFNIMDDSKFFTTVRFDTWGNLYNRLWDVPFFGVGYKSFQENFGAYIDNSYLSTWIEVGIIGFVLFILFWTLVLVRFGYIFAKRGGFYSAFGLALTVAFMMRMVTGGANASWSAAPLYFAALALLLRLASVPHRKATG